MLRDWQIFNVLRRFSLFFLGLLLLVGCRQEAVETVYLNGATMGTSWSVNMHSFPAGIDVSVLKQQLQQCLERINVLMSTYDPDSEISRFNQQVGNDWFTISAETADVIDLSLQISMLTDGAFDISVGPLVELWGFGVTPRAEQVPSEQQVRELLGRVGYQRLHLRCEPAAIRKLHPQLRIDLSAVAKGYAVDRLAELLKQQGIADFLVEIGGEMQISGRRSDGRPWRIAIEEPHEGARNVAAIFPLTATALATSGNYRNFYIENGQRYVHTLDPASGMPIRHQLASVTVLAASCARADALATALMVMGEDAGRHFVEQNRIAAYFLIQQKDATIEYQSPAFTDFLQKVNN